MSAGTPPALWTTEALLGLPEDGMDRELIRGELRERPMTRRNQWHSRAESRIAYHLLLWLDANPDVGGEVVSGESGFCLARDPDTTVGIDVAVVGPEVVARTPRDAAYFEGAPVLAVEILSPSDKHQEVTEKVRLYQEAGVAVVWVVNPDDRTVTVYEQGEPPRLVNVTQELTAGPHLPGFRVRLSDLFPS